MPQPKETLVTKNKLQLFAKDPDIDNIEWII